MAAYTCLVIQDMIEARRRQESELTAKWSKALNCNTTGFGGEVLYSNNTTGLTANITGASNVTIAPNILSMPVPYHFIAPKICDGCGAPLNGSARCRYCGNVY